MNYYEDIILEIINSKVTSSLGIGLQLFDSLNFDPKSNWKIDVLNDIVELYARYYQFPSTQPCFSTYFQNVIISIKDWT